MYDIDPQPLILRLAEPKAEKPLTTSQRLFLAEREMEEAIKRWVDAHGEWVRERAQSRPISAVRQNVGDGAVRF
jgi:hypothetical protein